MAELVIKNSEVRIGYFEIRLIGRLDTTTAEQLDRFFSILKENMIHHLYFDLSELDYISSLGLREIFKIHKYVVAQGGKVAAGKMQPQIKAVFKLAKALPDFSIFESVAEADAYLDQYQKKHLND